jgi:hypothetical protein
MWKASNVKKRAQWVRQLDYLTTHTSLSPIRRGFAPSFLSYKKGALDSQPQVIKLASCLSMVDGSLRVLRLLPPLKLVAEILLKVALNTKIKSNLKIINFKNFFKYQIAIIVQLRTDVFFDGFCFGHTIFHIVS